MRVPESRRGSILIAITFVLLMVMMMAVTGVSMLLTQSHTSLDVMRFAEARAARDGASEYLQRRMMYDLDWSNLTDYTITFQGHQSDVAFTNATEDRVDVSVQASKDFATEPVTTNETYSVERFPSAFNFALFEADNDVPWTDPYEPLEMNNSNIEGGDIYVNGELTLNNSTVGGRIFTARDSGTGTLLVMDPQPKMPYFNKGDGYSARMPEFQAAIAANTVRNSTDLPAFGAPVDCIITGNETISGDRMCRDLIFRGTDITLQGHGTITARDIYIQDHTQTYCPNDYNSTGQYISSDGGCIMPYFEDMPWFGSRQTQIGPYDVIYRASMNEAATWQEAHDFCDGLIDNGYDDWRLPTIQEWRNTYFWALTADLGFDYPWLTDFVWIDQPQMAYRYKYENIPWGPYGDPNAYRSVCVRSRTPVRTGSVTIRAEGGDLVLAADRYIYHTDYTRTLKIEGDNTNQTPSRVFFYANVRIYMRASPYPGPEPMEVSDFIGMSSQIRIEARGKFTRSYLVAAPKDPGDVSYLYLGHDLEAMPDMTDFSGAVIVPYRNPTESEYNVMKIRNVNMDGLIYFGGRPVNSRVWHYSELYAQQYGPQYAWYYDDVPPYDLLYINNVTGRMSVVTRGFAENQITGLNITEPYPQNEELLPGGDKLPLGFEGGVRVVPESSKED